MSDMHRYPPFSEVLQLTVSLDGSLTLWDYASDAIDISKSGESYVCLCLTAEQIKQLLAAKKKATF